MDKSYRLYVDNMDISIWIRNLLVRLGITTLSILMMLACVNLSNADTLKVPPLSEQIVMFLNISQWQELEAGLQVIRAATPEGVELTAFKLSPDNFAFSIETQSDSSGSRVREIGEREGAVIVANAGFFAISNSGNFFPIGYLRLNNNVLSKGWQSDGGVLSFKEDGLHLTPTHEGIPAGEFDAIQSKPMLIEPGGIWAMGSNFGSAKPRTIICKLADGDIILSTVTRAGLSLFETGWIMRSKENGGFFGCDSAIAFDGGRSTQVWYSGDEKYSSSGISPVHNFFVVRNKDN